MSNSAPGSPARGGGTSGGQDWLDAHHDPLAGLQALSPCIALGDPVGDGEARLLVAHADRTLKIYKGTELVEEKPLMDKPTGVVAFSLDARSSAASQGRALCVAIAAGPSVYIYRNLRPYLRFGVPPLEIAEAESSAWTKFRAEQLTHDALLETLSAALRGGTRLSARSLNLIEFATDAERREYADSQKALPLVQETVVTCIATMFRSVEEPGASQCLVLGTENREVLILNAEANAIKVRVRLPSVPVSLAVSGTFDVGYRIVVACRSAALHTIKGGELLGSSIELEALPVDVVFVDAKTLAVACMNSTIHTFSVKGKKTGMIRTSAPVACIEPMALARASNFRGFIAATRDGQVRVYSGTAVVSRFETENPVLAMRFGPYGREDSALVLLHRSGALTVRMLPRRVTLGGSLTEGAGPPKEQDVPLAIPKKTRLFIELQQRERDNAAAMHNAFQRDLVRLRLRTSRSFLSALASGASTVSAASGDDDAGPRLSLDAVVHGLGPRFKLRLTVRNLGGTAVAGAPVVVSFNEAIYRVDRAMVRLPLLVPGLEVKADIAIICIDPAMGATGDVTVYVCNPGGVAPIMTAVVSMPMSDVVEE
jgi:Bardet-Biedl syndrome 1 protein